MRIISIFVLNFLFCFTFLFANNCADLLEQAKQLKTEKSYTLAAEQYQLVADCYLADGDFLEEYYRALDQATYMIDKKNAEGYEEQISVLETALDKIDIGETDLNFKINKLLAYYLTKNSQYQEAQKYFLAAEELLPQVTEIKDPANDIFRPLGDIYTRIGDLDQAMIYFQKALDHYQQNLPSAEKKYLLGRVYNSLGLAKQDQQNLVWAQELYEKGIEVVKNCQGRCEATRLELQLNLVGVLLIQKKLNAAQNTKDLIDTVGLDQVPSYYFYYQILTGDFAIAKEDYVTAIDYYQAALNTAQEYYQDSPNRREIAKVELSIAETALHLKQYDRAIANCQSALQRVIPNYQPTTPTDLPTIEQLYPENVIFEALERIGTTIWEGYRQQVFTTTQLPAAQSALMRALDMQKLFLESYAYDSSKLLSLEQHYQLNEILLAILKEQYRLESKPAFLSATFACMEESRATLYRQQLRDQQQSSLLLQANMGIPKAILKRGLQQISNIRAQQKTVVNYQQEGRSAPAILSAKTALQNAQAEWEITLGIIRASLENSQPGLAKRLFEQQTITLAQVQDSLHQMTRHVSLGLGDFFNKWLVSSSVNQQQIIEYFYGQDSIYILSIPANATPQLFSLQKDTAWEKRLQQFIFSINDENFARAHDSDPATYQQFTAEAYYFYQQLIEPALNQVFPTDLIIVPSGLLHELPFDALLVNKEDSIIEAPSDVKGAYRNLPYLFQKTRVNYTASTTIFYYPPLSAVQPTLPYLGIAPSYGQNSGYAAIVEGNSTVISIADQLNGSTLVDQQANKKEFETKAAQARYLHFHGHATVDRTIPLASSIIFSTSSGQAIANNDNNLRAAEIYSMHLPTLFLFMAGCESGSGQHNIGEGVFNLERAFRSAGVQNILTGRWQVNSQTTADLAQSMFSILANNPTPDFSTHWQKARAEYLQQANYSHPYYWSGLMLTAMPSNAAPSVISWWLIIGAGLLLFGFVWIMRKRQ